MMAVGIYVHIPFCAVKCPYCDFYSISYNKQTAAAYSAAVMRNMQSLAGKYTADTLFFGGGTPSLLGEHICSITECAKEAFGLNNAEITIEANPRTVNDKLLAAWRNAGINRISFGVQSLCDSELATLGRKHNSADALREIKRAKEIGFDNISADLMIGIPHQTEESLKTGIELLAQSGVTHISAYMLQIEEGTPFFENGIESICPDEDATADLYLTAIRELKKYGFCQYEISNFALPSYESKHNLKYWQTEEYLGFGASAHSFIGNVRYAVPSDCSEFINLPLQKIYVTDNDAGSAEEFEMLGLRLTKGLEKEKITERFGDGEFDRIKRNALKIKGDLVHVTDDGISLTENGFLVSNDLIARIIFG